MATTKKAAAPKIGRQLRRSMSVAPAPLPMAMTAAAASPVAPAAAPAPGKTAVDPRIAAVHAAREAAEIVLAELLHRSDDVLTADDMAELQPEIELARGTINDCAQKEIDLTAASVTVAPLDPASVAKLQSLAETIDAATVRSAVLNASLEGLGAILNSAIRINAML